MRAPVARDPFSPLITTIWKFAFEPYAAQHMSNFDPQDATCPSLVHGVFEAAGEALGIANIRHKSALLNLDIPDGLDLASLVYAVVSRNWEWGKAADNCDRSKQNWRWSLQPQIGAANKSPEVVLERAIAAACASTGRTDWANQVPVASGMIARASDRRRAIDLVERTGARTYQLIELKIASDTPLFAAVELLGYASIWLLSRKAPPLHDPELLRAEKLDLRVLAPSAFYNRYDLHRLEEVLKAGARSLGEREGVPLTFGFDVLPTCFESPALPEGSALLGALEGRRPLHD